MKRMIGLLSIVIIFCLGGITVFADAMYDTAGDLYESWYDNMPDYICGVWSTDGSAANLTFGIQDTDEGNIGKQEILDLIADDSTVSFVYQKYSRNYLTQIQEELLPYFEKDLGIVSSGVYEMENRVGIEIHIQRKDDIATKKMIAELQAKYGDAIYIEYAEGYVFTTIGAVEEKSVNNNIIIILVVLAVFLFSLTIVYALKKNSTTAMQTNTGSVISGSSGYSSREIEGMVKESAFTVSSELDNRIKGTIDDIK